MAVRGERVYVEFTGTGGSVVAIKMVDDIYRPLASTLGATVKAADAPPSDGAVVVTSKDDALRNGVAQLDLYYSKGKRTQKGEVLCSASNADTALSNITNQKYRNQPITSGRFSG